MFVRHALQKEIVKFFNTFGDRLLEVPASYIFCFEEALNSDKFSLTPFEIDHYFIDFSQGYLDELSDEEKASPINVLIMEYRDYLVALWCSTRELSKVIADSVAKNVKFFFDKLSKFKLGRIISLYFLSKYFGSAPFTELKFEEMPFSDWALGNKEGTQLRHVDYRFLIRDTKSGEIKDLQGKPIIQVIEYSTTSPSLRIGFKECLIKGDVYTGLEPATYLNEDSTKEIDRSELESKFTELARKHYLSFQISEEERQFCNSKFKLVITDVLIRLFFGRDIPLTTYELYYLGSYVDGLSSPTMMGRIIYEHLAASEEFLGYDKWMLNKLVKFITRYCYYLLSTIDELSLIHTDPKNCEIEFDCFSGEHFCFTASPFVYIDESTGKMVRCQNKDKEDLYYCHFSQVNPKHKGVYFEEPTVVDAPKSEE